MESSCILVNEEWADVRPLTLTLLQLFTWHWFTPTEIASNVKVYQGRRISFVLACQPMSGWIEFGHSPFSSIGRANDS